MAGASKSVFYYLCVWLSVWLWVFCVSFSVMRSRPKYIFAKAWITQECRCGILKASGIVSISEVMLLCAMIQFRIVSVVRQRYARRVCRRAVRGLRTHCVVPCVTFASRTPNLLDNHHFIFVCVRTSQDDHSAFVCSERIDSKRTHRRLWRSADKRSRLGWRRRLHAPNFNVDRTLAERMIAPATFVTGMQTHTERR